MEKISLLIFALLCVSCVSKQEYQRLEQENIRFKNEIILLQKQVKDFQQQVKQKEWRYTIFRAEGLREGDKGILAYRKKSSPYVVTYNNLVMSSTIAILRMRSLQLAPSL